MWKGFVIHKKKGSLSTIKDSDILIVEYRNSVDQDNIIRTVEIPDNEIPTAPTEIDIATWFTNKGVVIDQKEIILWKVIKAPNSYLLETTNYISRVEADGGIVVDPDAVNQMYTFYKSKDLLSSIKHHSAPTFGIKKDSTGRVSKLYDIGSNNIDFYSDVGSEQPLYEEADKSIYYDGITKRFRPTTLFTGTDADMIVVLKAFYDVPPDTTYTGHPHSYADSSSLGAHYPWTTGRIYESFWTTARFDFAKPGRLDIYNIYAVESKSNIYKARMNDVVAAYRTSNSAHPGDANDQIFPKTNYKGWIRDYVFTNGLTDAQRTEIHNHLNARYIVY